MYLPSIFFLWKSVFNSLTLDISALQLLAYLSSDSYQYHHSTLGKYGIFTKDQMSFIFTKIIRIISSFEAHSLHDGTLFDMDYVTDNDMFKSTVAISQIIVYSISFQNTMEGDSILTYLENMITYMESVYSVRNGNTSGIYISPLLYNLANEMEFGWFKNATCETISDKRNQRDAVKDRAVKALRHITFAVLESSNSNTLDTALKCLNHLAHLSPNLILPFVLKEAYHNLNITYENKRKIWSLRVLSQVTEVLAQVPRYAMHLSTLLTLAISCIESNDCVLTYDALVFIRRAAVIVPFWDLSNDFGILAVKYISNDVDCLNHLIIPNLLFFSDTEIEDIYHVTKQITTELPKYSDDLTEEIWTSSTYLFQQFVTDLFDRIFRLAETISDQFLNFHSDYEDLSMRSNLTHVLECILPALPSGIHSLVVTKFLDFISDTINYSANVLISSFAFQIVNSNPTGVFPQLFSILKSNIESEISENELTYIRHRSVPLSKDIPLLWYISILSDAFLGARNAILNQKTEIFDFIMFLCDNTVGEAYHKVAVAAGRLIVSLLKPIILNIGVISDPFSKIAGRDVTLKNWGTVKDPREVTFEWYTVSREGVDFCFTLANSLLENSFDDVFVAISSDLKNIQKQVNTSSILKDATCMIDNLMIGLSLMLDSDYRYYHQEDYEFPKSQYGESNYFKNSFKQKFDKLNTNSQEYSALDEIMLGLDSETAFYYSYKEESSKSKVFEIKNNKKPGLVRFSDYPIGYFFEENRSDPLYTDIHKLYIRIAHVLHEAYSFLKVDQTNNCDIFKSLINTYRYWFAGCRMTPTSVYSKRVFALYYDVHSGGDSHRGFSMFSLVRCAKNYHNKREVVKKSPKIVTELEECLFLDVLNTSVYGDRGASSEARYTVDAIAKYYVDFIPFATSWIIDNIFSSFRDENLLSVENGMEVLLLPSFSENFTYEHIVFTKIIDITLKAFQSDSYELTELAHIFRSTFTIGNSFSAAKVPSCYQSTNALVSENHFSEEIIKFKKINNIYHEKTAAQCSLVGKSLYQHLKNNKKYDTSVHILEFLIVYVSTYTPRLRLDTSLFTILNELSFEPDYAVSGLAMTILNCYIWRTLIYAVKNYDWKLMYKPILNPNEKMVSTQCPLFTEEFARDFKNHDNPKYYLSHWTPSLFAWESEIKVQTTDFKEIIFSTADKELFRDFGQQIDTKWLKKVIRRHIDIEGHYKTGGATERIAFDSYIFALITMGYTKLTLDEAFTTLNNSFDLTDTDNHRVCAEIMAGILESTKISSINVKKRIDFVCQKVTDIIENHITEKSLFYWEAFFADTFKKFDYRIIKDLFFLVTNSNFENPEDFSFKDDVKLSLLIAVCKISEWTVAKCSGVLEYCLSNLSHPKTNRFADLMEVLELLHSTAFVPLYSSARAFLTAQQQAPGSLGQSLPAITENDEEIIKVIKLIKLKGLSTAEEDDQESIKSAKSLCCFFMASFSYKNGTRLISLFLSVVLPSLLESSVHNDQYLRNRSQQVVGIAGKFAYSASQLDTLVSDSTEYLKTFTKWRQSTTLLCFYGNVFVANIFTMSSQQRMRLVMAIVEVLENPKLEVREFAAQILAHMIQCSPVVEQKAFIKQLHPLFNNMLATNKAPRKLGIPANAEEQKLFRKIEASTTGSKSTAISRHAAVLGLSALITAFPYLSPPPKWIPKVLVTLTSVASESGVAGKVAKIVLSNFKANRIDTWKTDLLMFTKDQLESMEGVLWVNYYA